MTSGGASHTDRGLSFVALASIQRQLHKWSEAEANYGQALQAHKLAEAAGEKMASGMFPTIYCEMLRCTVSGLASARVMEGVVPAMLGRAWCQWCRGELTAAEELFQKVLQTIPSKHLVVPRMGTGCRCCLSMVRPSVAVAVTAMLVTDTLTPRCLCSGSYEL